MESDIATNLLTLTLLTPTNQTSKEVRKIILEFTNNYERYIFKTIVYNHLVIYINKCKLDFSQSKRKNRKST
jgi:hypothetical protein